MSLNTVCTADSALPNVTFRFVSPGLVFSSP